MNGFTDAVRQAILFIGLQPLCAAIGLACAVLLQLFGRKP